MTRRCGALAGIVALTVASTAHASDETRIIGGQVESRYPAVGALLAQGEWFCSGTAIAPRVVLTAAHCLEGLESADQPEFFMGADANRPNEGRRIRATGIHPHPNYAQSDDYDIGVILLAEDVGVETIPAHLDALSDNIIGKKALFVGYGITSVEDYVGGQKRSVEIPISELNAFFVGYNTPGINTCSGDSGGPAMLDFGNGLEVIGVTSYGDENCEQDGYNTRSDIFADWITPFLEGDVPSDPPPSDDPPQDDPPQDDPPQDDFCAAEGWYGDGICDHDCPNPDPDCSGSDDPGPGTDPGEGDFCAAEGWYNDGICDEGCANPDPDCANTDDGWDDGGQDDNPGSDGDFCAAEGWYNDGICDEGCANPDPDCSNTDDGWDDGWDDGSQDGHDDADCTTDDDDWGWYNQERNNASDAATTEEVVESGCQGGQGPIGFIAALLGLAFLMLRRRQATPINS